MLREIIDIRIKINLLFLIAAINGEFAKKKLFRLFFLFNYVKMKHRKFGSFTYLTREWNEMK